MIIVNKFIVNKQEIEKRLRNAGFSKAEIATIMNTELFFKDVSAFFNGHSKNKIVQSKDGTAFHPDSFVNGKLIYGSIHIDIRNPNKISALGHELGHYQCRPKQQYEANQYKAV